MKITKDSQTLTAQQLLEHWQGHRSLTRRVIEAFPDDKLFTYTVGGMRPFSELALISNKSSDLLLSSVNSKPELDK